MTISEFSDLILARFGMPPTDSQRNALDTFGRFLARRNGRPAMIMRGAAGTGKTSLVAAMVQTLRSLDQSVVLLAPTGRAAKVLSRKCRRTAYTIHRWIYRLEKNGDNFELGSNNKENTLFIVDEASMINTRPSDDGDRSMPKFGGGGDGVLDDLVTYVYSGFNCRLMFIGDTAQLPPVGESESPALQARFVSRYGLDVLECDLTDVVRQQSESGILWNATMIRRLITRDSMTLLPQIRFRGFPDVRRMPGGEIVDCLSASYASVGEDETVVVTRYNAQALRYNQGIRSMVVDRDGVLCGGDRIMIVKNHYFDDNPKGGNDGGRRRMSFVANGDMAVVRRIRNVRERYGLRFADLTMSFPDYGDDELTLTTILDVLYTDTPALPREQREAMLDKLKENYRARNGGYVWKLIKKDPYLCALQIKFAYAITCHKAQGGQWKHVYVDVGYYSDERSLYSSDYFRWLYTAFTRATDTVFLVNWPAAQTAEGEVEEDW